MLFNYLFSNGDAHLKNFSLIESSDGDLIMSPAYDLVCTRIHVNDSYMALKDGLTEDSLNHPSFSALGYFGYDDFFDFGLQLGLKDSRIIKIIDQMRTENKNVYELIGHSYLDNDTKQEYEDLYKDKLARLNTSFEKRI